MQNTLSLIFRIKAKLYNLLIVMTLHHILKLHAISSFNSSNDKMQA